MPDRVAAILAGELARSGFEPEPLTVKLVGARMADRGADEFDRLARSIPRVSQFESFCVHHLGAGASLTEFLVSGTGREREHLSEIAFLGGIAHTIYAAFDRLLDSVGSVPELFGRLPFADHDSAITAEQRLVIELVDFYLQRLHRLASKSPGVEAFIERAIHRLYEAELRSGSGHALAWKTWWRKNALPIVVMGLPVWLLTCNKSKIRFPDHLLWLGRVGEFFGWVDDFADFEQDYACGHANWLRLASQDSISSLARRVAAKGRRVLHLWDERNQPGPARDTFLVIVWMWLRNRQAATPGNHHASRARASGSEPPSF
jgi:hypothetical protein